MSRLSEMIKELCPDGVEYRKLKEIFDTRNGYTPSKSNDSYWENGTIPWFRMEDIRENGHILSDSIQHVNSKAIKGDLFPANSIIVATSATIGEHALITVPSLANQRFTYLMLKHEFTGVFDIKFLFYYCYKLDLWCLSHLNQGSFPSVDMKQFAQFEIPVPPLPIQNEIVKLLDNFTELTAELTAELVLRKKQYEYYRDSLLSFEKEQVERVKIESICLIQRGRVISKGDIAENKGDYPVYSSQTENNGELGRISSFDFEGEYLTWTTDGANAGTVFYRDGKFSITNVCGLLKVKPDTLLTKYLYYALSIEAPKYVNSGMGNPKLMSNVMACVKIPLPLLERQKEIVSILDRFDTLCSDLTQGLPAEIAARKKQYEYYRDKLLTFRHKEA